MDNNSPCSHVSILEVLREVPPQQGGVADTHRSRLVSPRERKDRGNKIPRVTLSLEAEELRTLLRQDIEGCLRDVVDEAMQDLRQDLREWLSHARMPRGEARPRTAARGDADGQGVPSKVVRVDSEPLELPDSPLDGSLQDNVKPSYRFGNSLTASLGPQLAGDAAHVPGPDEVTADRSVSNSVALGPRDGREDEDQESQAVRWEWERSDNMGWESYPLRQSKAIESAWQSGVSRTRVRSGWDGSTPMEIYFVDMVQLDPESENARRIRRVGKVPWYTRPRRLWRSVNYSLETGDPLWETLEQYRLRQAALSTAERVLIQKTRKGSDAVLRGSPVRRRLRRIVHSRSYISFFTLSCLVTLCWCVWFGVDLQHYPDGASIYEKERSFVAAGLFFSVFFLVELVMRIGACVSVWECLSDVWIPIDSLCVFGSLVDIVFVPMAVAVSLESVDHSDNTNFSVLRTLRLFKLLRIARLSRASLDMNVFCKGIWSGLKESSIVWAILIFLVFVFSVLLMTYSTDEMRETTFSTLGLTMNRLGYSGILLDGVADVFDGMAESRDFKGYMLFLTFVILSQYIILNMLIGILTSVAGDVRGEERARSKLSYLRHKLSNILECYIHDDGRISRKEFGLIIRNADLHNILCDFGTSIENLASMEKSMYAKTEHIDFDTMFETISQLNESQHATVKDLFYVKDALHQKLHSIESQLAANGFHGVP